MPMLHLEGDSLPVSVFSPSECVALPSEGRACLPPWGKGLESPSASSQTGAWALACDSFLPLPHFPSFLVALPPPQGALSRPAPP